MGAHWSYSVVGAAFNLLALLTFFGLATADVVPSAWYAVAGFFGLIILVGLGEGAYEAWATTGTELDEAKALLDRRQERRKQLKWLGDRLETGSALMTRLNHASMGEAERISVQFKEWDKETEDGMRERVPEFLPEYVAPILSDEDRRSSTSWRDSAFRYWQIRVKRLMEIREQFRAGDE
jgi:hypothetical protein